MGSWKGKKKVSNLLAYAVGELETTGGKNSWLGGVCCQ